MVHAMNTIRVGLLLTALTALFVAVGAWLGGSTGMVIALVLALAMNIGTYWFSDRLVLTMTGAKPLTPTKAPRLYRMTERLAREADIPMPRLYLVPDPQPNAFATGRSPEHGVVAVNEGLLQILDDREVEGVIAHEIAHIKHRDTLTMAIVASLAGAVMTLVNLAQWAAIFGSEEEDGPGLAELFVAALVAPLAATLIQLGVSRAREFEADRTAAELAGSSHGLIGALQKLERGARLVPAHATPPQMAHMQIVNGLRAEGGRLTGGLSRLFMTHPPVAARVERLRALDRERAVRRPAVAA